MRARWPWILGALFVAAFLWRASYLSRLAASPLGGSLTEDALIYWRWAGFLQSHGPWGRNPFFLGPLYPYVLAGLRSFLGDSVQGVLMVQALWGAASVALLADAARRLTSPAIGLAVGILMVFYEMAVFFDGLVLMESLLFFLESLLLWWAVHTQSSARRWVAMGVSGVLIGLLAEGRATASLLLIPAIVLLARRGGTTRQSPAALAALLAGFAAITVPVALRNRAVSGEWIPFTYNAGINLYIGNAPRATGAFVPVTEAQFIGAAVGGGEDGGGEVDGREFLRKTEGVALGPRASSAYWADRAWEFARREPGRVAGLAARKVAMMWNRREYPQIENLEEYRMVAGPVGVPWIGTFAVVGALGAAGLLLAWGRGGAARFVAGYAVVTTLAIAPFFVTDRYRHHLVPAAVLLTALALERAGAAWRERGPALPRLGAALLAGAVLVQLPAPELGRDQLAWGIAFDLGTRWLEKGRPDLAAEQFERAVRMEREGQVRDLSPSNRADLYYDYGNALNRLGRPLDALEWYRRAVGVAPGHAPALRALADAEAAGGRAARADSLYQALESKSGGDELALMGRGWAAAREGRLDEAERLFTQAVQERPEGFEAWGALLRVQIQANRLARAESTLARARAAGLSRPASRAYEALLAALGHDAATARRALAEIPEAALAGDPTLAEVVRLARQVLGQSSP